MGIIKKYKLENAEQIIELLKNKPTIFHKGSWFGWDVIYNIKKNILIHIETGAIFKPKEREIPTTKNQKEIIKKYIKTIVNMDT